jgi:hypothetical protein
MKIVDGPINKDGRATYYNVDLHEMRRGSRLEQIGADRVNCCACDTSYYIRASNPIHPYVGYGG